MNLSDKVNLKKCGRCVDLSNRSIYSAWKNIKKSYKNNKSKTSTATWNEKLELADG